MRLFIFLVLVISLRANADEPLAVDHLSSFQSSGGAHFFCNALERATKRPEVNTSCVAVMLIHQSPQLNEALARNEFGKALKSSTFGDSLHLFVSEVTVEQLEILRFDSRIKALAPDFPLGGVGAFTVKN